MTDTDHNGHILVVDDEPSMRTTLSILLRREGYEVSQAGTGAEALGMLEQGGYDMVLTDLKMEGIDGMELLRHIKAAAPQTEVLIFTAYGTIATAVEAMKLGAYDYIGKPFDEEELLLKVARALERKALVSEVRDLRAELKGQGGRGKIIAASKQMREVLARVRQVAPTEATVLIEGESGTGKEVVARAIHQASPRSDRPFIPVNCSAFPETLLESELFGYEKGAFTGADKARKGLFEAAHTGTLLLDEIGDMPPPLQGKLLRVLQEGEVRRLGSTVPIKVQVRIVTATNKGAEQLVAQGTLREDLFYRLNVVRISIPPLRERPDDIIPLAQHFLEICRKKAQKEITGFAPDAVKAMLDHPWPGNVRELENAVERGAITCRSPSITAQDLSLGLFPLDAASVEKGTTLKELEQSCILTALERHGGNQAKAARELGIGRNTLWRRLKEYGLLP
ncbi:MAG: sigma-54-dependent Fis family transcriptional regulator [Deltaproteobacteria bacterium]|nr:sigma-54-dependent Fis family transcriptional regulator [Deltaproteobacteria bacterium]